MPESLENKVKKILGPELAKRVDIVDLNKDSDDTIENAAKSIGVGNDLCPESVLKKATELSLPRIVQESSVESESEIHSSANLIVSGDDFLNFPIASILDPKNIGEQKEKELCKFNYEFWRSDQKMPMLEKLESYLFNIVGRESLVGDILGVADELFTNAIFNAPFVAEQNNFKGADRRIVTESDKKANFYVGDNGKRVVLAAIDRYGSLDFNRLLKKVRTTYEDGADKTINLTEVGGAGLGTFMMFEICSSMYLIVRPGEYTMVAVTIPLGLSRRAQKKIPKNLHCIEI